MQRESYKTTFSLKTIPKIITAMVICTLLNTETLLMFVFVIPTVHKYWANQKNIIPNTTKENMQDFDGIVSFGMKIDDSASGLHIIVTPRYSTRLSQITGKSLVFSKNFFNKICPTSKDILLCWVIRSCQHQQRHYVTFQKF